jgi:hypothetical protein
MTPPRAYGVGDPRAPPNTPEISRVYGGGGSGGYPGMGAALPVAYPPAGEASRFEQPGAWPGEPHRLGDFAPQQRPIGAAGDRATQSEGGHELAQPMQREAAVETSAPTAPGGATTGSRIAEGSNLSPPPPYQQVIAGK